MPLLFRSHNRLQQSVLFCMFSFGLITTTHWSAVAQAQAAYDYDAMAQAYGRGLYFLAWPTADYRGATVRSVMEGADRSRVTVRIYGESDQRILWTDTVFTIVGGRIVSIVWGDNNASFLAPGASARIASALIEQLGSELKSQVIRRLSE